MGEDEVLDVANSGKFWLIVPAQPWDHSEGADGYCVICADVVWPCGIWVDDREAYDAEVVES